MTRDHREDQGAAPDDDLSAKGHQVVSGRRGRAALFVQLALALDDLQAASACLTLASQSQDRPSQVRQAMLSAMVAAYGRLFPPAQGQARGLPDHYEPDGHLLATHLELLGMRNLMHQHGVSSSRRVMVGPTRGRSIEWHVALGSRIVWSVRQDPLGPLDLQQVDALFQHLRARVELDASQLCSELFAGRAVPLHDVVLEDAQH